MAFKVDYQGSFVRDKIEIPHGNITALGPLSSVEFLGIIKGKGAIWGPEEHTTEGGFRGDTKPDDNSEGESIMLPPPDHRLPPEGEIVDLDEMRSFDREVGHDALSQSVDLALVA